MTLIFDQPINLKPCPLTCKSSRHVFFDHEGPRLTPSSKAHQNYGRKKSPHLRELKIRTRRACLVEPRTVSNLSEMPCEVVNCLLCGCFANRCRRRRAATKPDLPQSPAQSYPECVKSLVALGHDRPPILVFSGSILP